MNLPPSPVSQRTRAVTTHALEYMVRWHEPSTPPSANVVERRELIAKSQTELCALVLVAAGHGSARVTTCEQTLRHASTRLSQQALFLHDGRYAGPFFDYPCARDGVLDYGPKRAGDFYPVLVHALSLFGPGELRELRVPHVDVFRVIVAMMQVLPSGGALLPQMAQALDSLRAIEVPELISLPTECWPHVAAIVACCSATITELKGPLPGRLLCEPVGPGIPPALARCTRLEILTQVCDYTPAVWLGLSQLHTLRDVDLRLVSTTAMAAALPNLHTLKAYCLPGSSTPAAVAGFSSDLLPRLRVFHFEGRWPAEAAEDAARIAPPLPLLEELAWNCVRPEMLSEFLGARPTVLHAPYGLVAECLADRDPRSELLTRVSDLRVVFGRVAPADIARVLRAAPRLRTFCAEPVLHGNASWLTASALPLGEAFSDLVHPRLRSLNVNISGAPASRDDGCASRLRQTCFPRLQQLQVNDEMFFVTIDG